MPLSPTRQGFRGASLAFRRLAALGLSASGLPVGAQLVTGPFEDSRLLALAAALEAQLES